MARRKSGLPPSPRVIHPDATRPRLETVTRPRPVVRRVVKVSIPLRDTPLQQIEDRRRWHPLRYLAPAATLGSRSARSLVERSPKSKSVSRFPSLRLGFAVPEKVAVCVRRKTRKEVIFAKKVAGKGASARRRKRNPFSEIRC